MEVLEGRGIVGPQVGSAPREILLTRDERDNPLGGAPLGDEDDEDGKG